MVGKRSACWYSDLFGSVWDRDLMLVPRLFSWRQGPMLRCVASLRRIRSLVATGSVPLGDRCVRRPAGSTDPLLVGRLGERHEAGWLRWADRSLQRSRFGLLARRQDPEALSDSFVHFAHVSMPREPAAVRTDRQEDPRMGIASNK